jgi:hypothetical protein
VSGGEPVWGFRCPDSRIDPDPPYAEGGLHLGFNHPPLGRDAAGQWVTAVLEWQPLGKEQYGTDRIGDFTVGCTLAPCVFAVREVGEELARRFKGLELGPVDFWQHPRLAKVKRPRIPRVQLPYRGPPLCYLHATHAVPLDLERSTVTVERNEAGEVTDVHSFRGIESVGATLDGPLHVPRRPDCGLFFRESDLGGLDFWYMLHCRIGSWGHPHMYCRDRVKRFIEEAGYTNVKFREVGEIVED